MITATVPKPSKSKEDITNYTTGAVRDTGGKGRMDLLPMCSLLRISRHMENSVTPDPNTGVPHYPERNWEKGMPMHNMIDSAMRHLVKYMDGQTDEDHLCAAATNLLMAMWTEEKMPEMQDIPTRPKPITDKPMGSPQKNYSVCSKWVMDHGEYRCYGTKEREICTCGGNASKCDFYPKKP